MNVIFLLLVLLSVVTGLLAGQGGAMTDALLASGPEAIALCLTLAGAYALWCGLMNVLEEAGAMAALAKLFSPVMALFPGVRGNRRVEESIAANLAANVLGLGNAATPAGIEAILGMKELCADTTRASDAMRMFLVINASSIQLLPTTIISMRAAAGSQAPFDIVLPVLVATGCSTLAAVLFMKMYIWGERRLGDGGRRRDSRVGGGYRAAGMAAWRKRI